MPRLEENFNQEVSALRDLRPRPPEADAIPLRRLWLRTLQQLRKSPRRPVHARGTLRAAMLGGATAAGYVGSRERGSATSQDSHSRRRRRQLRRGSD